MITDYKIGSLVFLVQGASRRLKGGLELTCKKKGRGICCIELGQGEEIDARCLCEWVDTRYHGVYIVHSRLDGFDAQVENSTTPLDI